jgi:hypothetical protein
MSSYLPPLQTSLSIFNPSYWEYSTTTLTYSTAYKLFLSINGNETVGGLVKFAGGIDVDTIGSIASGDVVSIYSGTTDVADFASSYVNINQTLQLNSNGTKYASLSYNNGNLLITTSGGAVFSGNLTVDGNIYNSAGSIIGSPSGSSGSIQYNNSGGFGGSSNLTYNSTNNVLSIGQSSNSYQSTTALNVYGNVNIANQFQPGQTSNSTTLTIGNGVLSSSFGNGLTVTTTDTNMTLNSGGNFSFNTNSGGLGSKIYLNGIPTIGSSNNSTGSCGIYTYNGYVGVGSTSYVNLGTSGYIIVSFWTGTLKGNGYGNYNGNWSFAQGIAMGNNNGIVLTVSGNKPAISTNNTGTYGQLNLYNNASTLAYYNVWLFADGVTG